MEKHKALPIVRDLQGNVITVADLPPGKTTRWTPNKKAIVVRAVRNGLIPLQNVLERYQMNEIEFKFWENGLQESGITGLKITKFQERRILKKP